MPASDKPRQPQLSALAARAAARAPLKPKVAAASPANALARRRQALGDQASIPASPSLADARLARVGSASSTPAATPPPADGWDNGRSAVSTPTHDGSQTPDANKFFYASDARTTHRPLSLPQKQVPFFYANDTRRPVVSSEHPSPRIFVDNSSPRPFPENNSNLRSFPEHNGPRPFPENGGPRFVYANGAPEAPSIRPILSTSVSASVVPTAPVSPTRPATTTSASLSGLCIIQRSVSPTKSVFAPAATSTSALGASGSKPPLQPCMLVEPPIPVTKARSSSVTRRVSVDTTSSPSKRGDSRQNSVTSLEMRSLDQCAASPAPSHSSHTPSSPIGPTPPSTMTMASMMQAAEELRQRRRSQGGQSESQSSHQAAEPISELVANARRERKVQDLEITNASLEAINRTLERQLRKQTAEMRRLRRQSRLLTGRSSLASGASGSRKSSAALTDPLADLSDLSDDDGHDDDDGSLMLGESDSSNNAATAAAATADSASAHAPRRRLHLDDLAKHQALLVDSQKMNQSLKRCLDWTDELIVQGQRALAYKVHVSDVRFGGRVLAPPDDDDDDDDAEGDGDGEAGGDGDGDGDDELDAPAASPAPPVNHVDTAPPMGQSMLAPPWLKRPQDRDSGISLRVDSG